MIQKLPNRWSETSGYSLGTLVNYFGSIYECVVPVPFTPGTVAGNEIPVGNPSWAFKFVYHIEDFYSLQNDIMIAMNTDDKVIINSIPKFIREGELKINKVLRSPNQIVTQKITAEEGPNGATVFPVPNDVLQILHMGLVGETYLGSNPLLQAGQIAIEAATDKQYFIEIRREEENTSGFFNRANNLRDSVSRYPVYWMDRAYIYLAPDVEVGTEIELSYYAQVPLLGTRALRTNNDFEPVNVLNLTLAEHIAGGGIEGTFHQAEDQITQNIWTKTAPELLRLASLVSAEAYLNDLQMIPVWKAQYQENLAETIESFNTFTYDRQYNRPMTNAYFY